MIYFLITSILINLIFGYYLFKFSLMLINVKENVENCLDKIDMKYNRLMNILKIPVFYDSPEIKNIIKEISDVEYLILNIANDLTNIDKKSEDQEEYLNIQNDSKKEEKK